MFLFALAWNGLKGLRPTEYTQFSHYWEAFIWHALQPRTKKGNRLIRELKDLVRGTLYSSLENVIEAYKWFKAIDGVRIFAIKEKIKALNNITVNFVYKEKFIGEMQFQFLKQTKRQEEKYHANHFIYELERAS